MARRTEKGENEDEGKETLYHKLTSLVVWWSESLATDHEVPGSFPGSTMGIFPWGEGEDPHGDHGLGC
jgi:hypothetical protein